MANECIYPQRFLPFKDIESWVGREEMERKSDAEVIRAWESMDDYSYGRKKRDKMTDRDNEVEKILEEEVKKRFHRIKRYEKEDIKDWRMKELLLIWFYLKKGVLGKR